MVVFNIYVKEKPSCGRMHNCIETDKGMVVLYDNTLFNILVKDRVALPEELIASAIPVYVEQIHDLCVRQWSEGKSYVICQPLETGGEVCLCLSEYYWYVMRIS